MRFRKIRYANQEINLVEWFIFIDWGCVIRYLRFLLSKPQRPASHGQPALVACSYHDHFFYVLDIFGLIGLHSYQKNRAGLLGQIGIALAIIGASLAFILSLAFVIPATTAPPSELKRSSGPLVWIRILVWAWILAFLPGHIRLAYLQSVLACCRAGPVSSSLSIPSPKIG